MTSEPFRLGVVAGERSGERLAVGLIDALQAKTGRDIVLSGVGGEELAARGLNSLFDPADIALMGATDVALSLPRLLRRIGQTASHFIDTMPDCVLLVDSPDFSHRVARQIKAARPSIPVAKYVAPTVWAWRPERAAKMAGTIDSVMALFPFEPAVMEQLGGPPTTYVGHPLMRDEALTAVRAARTSDSASHRDKTLRLLVLPGSRSSEITSLIKDMGATVEELIQAGHQVDIRLPTLARHERLVHRQTAGWPVSPMITTTRAEQIEAYRWADCALCASGTVTLELALADVPAISLYRADLVMRFALSMITAWSAALPNIIADRQVIPEFYEDMIRPGMLMRLLVEMADRGSHRHAMIMEGYDLVAQRMALEANPAELAAAVVLETAERRQT